MIEFMLTKVLYKEMTKEIKNALYAESKDGIKEVCYCCVSRTDKILNIYQ